MTHATLSPATARSLLADLDRASGDAERYRAEQEIIAWVRELAAAPPARSVASAMELVRDPFNPRSAYAAAKEVGIHLSTMYKSRPWKAHVAALEASGAAPPTRKRKPRKECSK